VVRLDFAKGHGTQNDFVIVRDRHNMAPMTPDLVRRICDRHAGIGGDGLVRAVKAVHMPDWQGDPDIWFMDYRNADGSPAEMCANALRVFVRYLLEEDLAPHGEVRVATRSGSSTVWETFGGMLRCEMGPVDVGAATWLDVPGRRLEAVAVDVGNPHAVALLPSGLAPCDIDLCQAPKFDAARFPQGVNAEFVRIERPGHVTMRVFERGAGETRSCGTGAVASAAVARQAGAEGAAVTVDVPGGRLKVDFDEHQAYLTGPAVIVARGELTLPD